jgi:hypothetical protein
MLFNYLNINQLWGHNQKFESPQKLSHEFDTYYCLSLFWVWYQDYFQLLQGIAANIGRFYQKVWLG